MLAQGWLLAQACSSLFSATTHFKGIGQQSGHSGVTQLRLRQNRGAKTKYPGAQSSTGVAESASRFHTHGFLKRPHSTWSRHLSARHSTARPPRSERRALLLVPWHHAGTWRSSPPLSDEEQPALVPTAQRSPNEHC